MVVSTLTVKNVYDGKELNKSLSDMAKGFRRMMQYVKVAKNLVGFMRATEVTVNKTDNSYNQHMHVLLAVESTYFKNTENYRSEEHTSELQSRGHLVCRLLLEKKKYKTLKQL